MTEIRDADQVHAEHVAGFAAAVGEAQNWHQAVQAQGGAWLDGGLPAAAVPATPDPRLVTDAGPT